MPSLPDGFKILRVEHDYDCVGCQVLVAACVEDLQEAGFNGLQAVMSYPDFDGRQHAASVFHEPIPGQSASRAEQEQPA